MVTVTTVLHHATPNVVEIVSISARNAELHLVILVRVVVENMSCFSFQTSRLRLERAWVSSFNLGGV